MAQDPHRTPSPSWRHDLAAVGLLAVLGVLLYVRASTLGPTVDEPYHLIRGLAWWWTDSTKLSYAHPPLANALQALPVVLTQTPMDLTALPGWDQGDHTEMARALFAEHPRRARPWLSLARHATRLMTLALCVWAYLWTARRFGGPAGLIALGFLALNPTVIAHGRLVTTDLPATLGFVLATTTFIDLLQPRRQGRWWAAVDLGAFSLGLSVAILTKHSALVLVPAFLSLGVVWAAAGWGRYAGRPVWQRLLHGLAEAAVVALTAVVLLGAAYRFEGWGLTVREIVYAPEPVCRLVERFDGRFLNRRDLLNSLPRWLRLPVPYTWLFGLEMVRYQGGRGQSSWFMGLSYRWGNPAYFPVLLLLKTPWAVLIAAIAAAGLPVVRRRWPPADLAVLTLTGLTLLGLLIRSNLNLGVRHALPAVALLTLAIAPPTWTLLRGVGDRRPRLAGLIVAGLALTLVIPHLRRPGRPLGWFNIGPLGRNVSVVGEDWGQDATDMARAIAATDPDPVLHYARYGAASIPEVQAHGVKVHVFRCTDDLPTNGWLAVHTNALVRWKPCKVLATTLGPPDLDVGGHIHVWRMGD